MKKIKKFKVNIRKHEILRQLKNQQFAVTGADVDASIDRAITLMQDMISPSTVYETISRQSLRPEFAETISRAAHKDHSDKETQLDFLQDSIAVSVCAVTIGALAPVPPDIAEQVWHATAHNALDGATRFVWDLIKEEAEQEDCELSSAQTINDAARIREFEPGLDFSKIDLAIDEHGCLNPQFSRFVAVHWIPKKTAKRSHA
jgi:leucyl-tRNA synthetase